MSFKIVVSHVSFDMYTYVTLLSHFFIFQSHRLFKMILVQIYDFTCITQKI